MYPNGRGEQENICGTANRNVGYIQIESGFSNILNVFASLINHLQLLQGLHR
jgi:hypothetical protein